MYTIEQVTTFEQFSKLGGMWNHIVEQCAEANPFMTFEWMSCCLRALGHTGDLLILLVKDGDGTVAIAPFHRLGKTMAGMPLNVLALIGEEYYERNGFILARQDPAIVAAVIDHLYRVDGWEALSLNVVPVQSLTGREVRRLAAAGSLRCVEVPSDTSPYIPVESSWEEYLKSRSKNFRHKLHRTGNMYARAGDYEVVVYRREHIERALDEVERIGRQSWKQELRATQAGTPEKQPFNRLLARAMAPKGWLAVWVLRVAGVPVAYAYNLEYRRRTYALWIEFDERYGSISPSEFLNTHAIRDCFARGDSEYDWLGLNLPFKMKWTSCCREHRKFMIFNRTPRGVMLYFMRKLVIENINRCLGRGGEIPATTRRAGIMAGRREKAAPQEQGAPLTGDDHAYRDH